MRTFVQKENQPQRPVSSKLSRSHTEARGLHPRADRILHLQRTIGNQAVRRLLQANSEEFEVGSTTTVSPQIEHDFSAIPIHALVAGVIQTKLAISKPDDEHEQQADRVADRLMAIPKDDAVGGGAPPIQPVSRQSDRQIDSATASVDRMLSGSGRPLDTAVRHEMEQRFGHDFSRVRVHSGAAAEESAQNLNAHAYTVGYNMVFGAGQFAPGTHQGRRLIAHELAHVLQQQSSQASIQRQPATKDPFPFPAGEVYDQLEIVRQGGLPLEFYRRPEIRQLRFSDRQALDFRRKLEAIAKLGDLRDERAVLTLVAVVEDKLYVAPKDFEPQQKLLLQQEAVAALGKIGGPVALAKLNDLLNSKDPKERMMASRGFSGAAGGQAATDLLTALKKETDPSIRAQIIFALGNVGGGLNNREKELVVKELIREMETSGGDIAVAAINALGKIRHKSATEPLLKQIRQHLSIAPLVQDAIRSLGEIRDDRAVELLVIMLEKHGSKFVRSEAAIALGKIGGSKALTALKRRLSQEIEATVKADISKAIRAAGVLHLHWTFDPVQ